MNKFIEEGIRKYVESQSRLTMRFTINRRREMQRILTEEECQALINHMNKVNIDEMVDKFLMWELPEDFTPDCGIKFTPITNPNMWPLGTNLLTAEQAREMIMHMMPNPDPI